MNINAIAKVCHEVNRAFCQSIGDNSQPLWEEAPDWQKESAVAGVKFHLSGERTAADSHISWLEQKRKDGWVYGEVKDPVKKTHPCMVSFHKLPKEQQAKDMLFKAVVDSMREL